MTNACTTHNFTTEYGPPALVRAAGHTAYEGDAYITTSYATYCTECGDTAESGTQYYSLTAWFAYAAPEFYQSDDGGPLWVVGAVGAAPEGLHFEETGEDAPYFEDEAVRRGLMAARR